MAPTSKEAFLVYVHDRHVEPETHVYETREGAITAAEWFAMSIAAHPEHMKLIEAEGYTAFWQYELEEGDYVWVRDIGYQRLMVASESEQQFEQLRARIVELEAALKRLQEEYAEFRRTHGRATDGW